MAAGFQMHAGMCGVACEEFFLRDTIAQVGWCRIDQTIVFNARLWRGGGLLTPN